MTISRTNLALVALLATVILLWAASAAALSGLAQGGPSSQPQAAMDPWLQYQGRLTNSAGNPISGTYFMNFRLYDVPDGGMPLWFESKSIYVGNGVFSTALGDTAGMDPHFFNGQQLWLEVVVDYEVTTPRQEILPVAYALSLRPGALISDTSGEPVLTVLNRGAGDALRVDGNLNVSGDLIGGSHTHNSPQVRYDVRAGSAASYTITIPHFQLFRLEMASDWPNTYGMASLEGFENDGNTSVVGTRWDGRFGASSYGGSWCSCGSQSVLVYFGNAANSYGVRCASCGSGEPYSLVITRAGTLPVNFKLIY